MNTSKSLFDVPLVYEQPKMLIGCNQKVGTLSVTSITWVARRYRRIGIQKAPKSLVKVFMQNNGNVVEPPGMEKVTRKGAGDSASMRWRKKRMISCSGK